MTISVGSIDTCNLGTLNISTENACTLSETGHMWRGNNSDDDMCQIDDTDNFFSGGGTKLSTAKTVDDFNKVLSVSACCFCC